MSILRSHSYWADFQRRRRERLTSNPYRRVDHEMINPGCQNTPPIWTFTKNGVYMSNVLDNGTLRTTALTDSTPPSRPSTSLKDLQNARPVHRSTSDATPTQKAPTSTAKLLPALARAQVRLDALPSPDAQLLAQLQASSACKQHAQSPHEGEGGNRSWRIRAPSSSTFVSALEGPARQDGQAHSLSPPPRGHFTAVSTGVSMGGDRSPPLTCVGEAALLPMLSEDASFRIIGRSSSPSLFRGEPYFNMRFHSLLRRAYYRAAQKDLAAAQRYAVFFKRQIAPSEAVCLSLIDHYWVYCSAMETLKSLDEEQGELDEAL
ncbi:hypothetical protein C8R46DRAFT_1215751 [Mycena filopes]|nr:hypothetical protein C8R46DRAFT_1215751 [Mycena filopes]